MQAYLCIFRINNNDIILQFQESFMSIRDIPKGWLYTAIRLLSLAALFFASMLAVDYYFVAHTFCAEGASCAVVAQSEFGQKYGIFLPTLGLVAYSFFFLTSFFFARSEARFLGKNMSKFWVPLAIICCALGALGFIIIQAIEIHAFCWLCMGIDTFAILMVIPAVLLLLQNKKAAADDEKAAPAKPSMLHPVLWLTFYLVIACGPIAWGTRPHEEPKAEPQANGSIVPDYIQSFYVPGKINVVEISSFECPHCRQLHPEFNKLLLEYGERINFTRLTIPLRQHKEACIAYFCAEKQKKASEFADCQFEEPSTDTGKILEYARQCSINEDAFKSCLTDPASAAAVDQILENIKGTGFEGAPTVWINETKIVGYNTKLGMDPYRAALGEKSDKSADAQDITRIAHTVTMMGLIAAIICLIAGIPLTIRRRKEKTA